MSYTPSKNDQNKRNLVRMPATLMHTKIEYNEGRKTDIDDNDGILLPEQQQLSLLVVPALLIKGDRSGIALHASLGIELGPSV